MVFSPYEFDADQGLICSIFGKIRKRKQGSAVMCFSNSNNLIKVCRMEGIYSNGAHNSSFLSVSASPLCLWQGIKDKMKAGVSQVLGPLLDNKQMCFLYWSTKGRNNSQRKALNNQKFSRLWEIPCKQFNKMLSKQVI